MREATEQELERWSDMLEQSGDNTKGQVKEEIDKVRSEK